MLECNHFRYIVDMDLILGNSYYKKKELMDFGLKSFMKDY